MKKLLFLFLVALFFFSTAHSQDSPSFEIEKVPVYPGCSGNNNEELKKCMMGKIMEHVSSHFNLEIPEESQLTGKQRINIRFTINSKGRVVNVSAKGPLPSLEAEAIRVIKKLPRMEAGEQKGKKVGIAYSIPIIFEAE